MTQPLLQIDIETYSSVNLMKSGVYAYASAPDFTVLLFAYAYDDAPVEVVDCTAEDIPGKVLRDLTDPAIIKSAYNANFERTCLAAWLGKPMPPEQWRCSAVLARYFGLPGSLGAVGAALNLPTDAQKDKQGAALIRYFSLPCKPTKANGGRTRNLPAHDPGKWALYKSYNGQDVEAERAIRKKLERLKGPSDEEQRLWELDQRINDAGVRLDVTLIHNALECGQRIQESVKRKAKALTGLDNPASDTQAKRWIEQVEGAPVETLRKESIDELKATVKSPAVKKYLSLRADLRRTSTAKYDAMARAVCPDGRARGLLQFYGANRTGRWAGRLIQVQNLRKNSLVDLDAAHDMLKCGEFDALELLFASVPDTLSQLIRTAFIPSEGCRFIVADFSAIEARVIAWLAEEQWRMEVFNGSGKIYEASAAQMFRVPVESIKKGDPLRQKGKIAELALGYGGGVGALKAMGALDMGLAEEDLPSLVSVWRGANPKITQFWWDADRCARLAIRTAGRAVKLHHGIGFVVHKGYLFIRLPSGRRLAYLAPEIHPNPIRGRDKITYMGVNQTSRKWERLDTYGPKLVENIVQAASRDCLAYSMLALADAGYDIVMHVHDEVILDVPIGHSSVREVEELMGVSPPWAQDLPLRAAGFECNYYQKD